MRILILGGTGMLGHRLHERLSTEHSVVSTSRRSLISLPIDTSSFFQRGRVVEGVDVTDTAHVDGLIEGIAPDVVINCVGVIKQRADAQDAQISVRVNSLLPHELCTLAERHNARLIHFSTDCVFSGSRGTYTEDDTTDAEDLYGRSKALGEVSEDHALTLRTSIIGRELYHFSSLVEWFLQQRGKVHGFRRAIYTGVTTAELADIVSLLLADHPDLHGIYQIASSKISKYALLTLIRDEFDLRSVVSVVPDDEFVSDRSLNGSRFLESTGIGVHPWDYMVQVLAREALRYRSLAA